MSGRHEGPPVGSAAREATAPPYHGKRRIDTDEAGTWTFRINLLTGELADEPEFTPDDPPRCGSCGHHQAGECGCLCCTWDHDERITDV